MSLVRIWQVVLTACLMSALSGSAAFAADSDVYFDVVVRGTGSATIHAKVYNNPANRGATTVLAVHGLTETATTWKPLASAMFADSTLGRAVKRVVAIDFIAHGESSVPTLPAPTKFGDLVIEDNVSVLIQSIDKLRALNLGAQVILGHSMGGLAIQSAQEVLLSSNSSLSKKGIVGAILLSSVPNRGSVWTQPPPSDPTPFIKNTPQLGTYLDLTPLAVQQGGSWRTLNGSLIPNVPSVATIDSNDWVGIEPISTVVELTGTMAPTIRPFARRNAFALSNKTVLVVISGSQDVLTPAIDQDDLYLYLTGQSSPLYRPVVASDAVHSMHISNPTGLLGALRNSVLN